MISFNKNEICIMHHMFLKYPNDFTLVKGALKKNAWHRFLPRSFFSLETSRFSQPGLLSSLSSPWFCLGLLLSLLCVELFCPLLPCLLEETTVNSFTRQFCLLSALFVSCF